MNIKLNVKLYSNKKYLPIKEINVPKEFGTPGLDKIMRKQANYIETGELDPIIVDENNNLIDGYVSLVIAKHEKWQAVKVYKITAKCKMRED